MPKVRVGMVLTCEARDDDVVVVGYSDAPSRGPSANAVWRESNQAVGYWWRSRRRP
jgi:hypothetical protein